MDKEQFKQTIQKIFEASGLDVSVEADFETNKVNIFIYDERIKEFFPKLIFDIEHLIKIIAKRFQIERLSVDVNNYKKERENIIVELARVAARKVLAEKKEITLPAMNAYERRLVHVELATRPDVKTESIGEGAERHIVIKPL
jgi:spoIIIJ-associated protein